MLLPGLHNGIGSRSCKTEGGEPRAAEKTGSNGGSAEESGTSIVLTSFSNQYMNYFILFFVKIKTISVAVPFLI